MTTTVKERPILFSAPMVRAILAGTKTQTRRLALRCGLDSSYDFREIKDGRAHFYANRKPKRGELLMPSFGARVPYEVGMRLWVKETWRLTRGHDALSPTLAGVAMGGDYAGCIGYAATPDGADHWGKTRVSIHMPRWASRITLEITEVRAERLQDISEEDAVAEGVTVTCGDPGCPACQRRTGKIAYRIIWEEINGRFSWEKNPWVWAISFRVVKP